MMTPLDLAVIILSAMTFLYITLELITIIQRRTHEK